MIFRYEKQKRKKKKREKKTPRTNLVTRKQSSFFLRNSKTNEFGYRKLQTVKFFNKTSKEMEKRFFFFFFKYSLIFVFQSEERERERLRLKNKWKRNIRNFSFLFQIKFEREGNINKHLVHL